MTSTQTLIIGASAAGLASAACLQKAGVEFVILEKYSRVATPWRNHYDRLHLHTSRKWSALPYKSFDSSLPQYPSRQDVVEYLDSYAREFNINPVFDTEVVSINKGADIWITETNAETFQSRFVIVATGRNNKPKMAGFEGLSSLEDMSYTALNTKMGKCFGAKTS